MVEIETVKEHTCAVREASPSMMCWGGNTYYAPDPTPQYGKPPSIVVHKLGPGAGGAAFSAVPVPVELKATDEKGQMHALDVLDVGMGYESTYAVTVDGRVYAWGWNHRMQLGIVNTDPLVVEPSLVMTQLSTGPEILGDARDVLRSDGSDQCVDMGTSMTYRYRCWGADHMGELGMGVEDINVQFADAATVVPRSAQRMVHGQDHACVLANESGAHEIWCYGRRWVIGDGTTSPSKTIPSRPEAAPVLWDPENFAPALEE